MTTYLHALRSASTLTLLLACAVVLIFPVSALGTRLGWWEYQNAFVFLRYEVILAIVVMLLSIILFILLYKSTLQGHYIQVVSSFVLSLVIVCPVGYQYYLANTLPAIHDITTDWQDPPQFVYPIVTRSQQANSLTYPGEQVAQQQRLAYPDIQTLYLSLDSQAAYQRALDLIHEAGWEIVAEELRAGIIEATATSFWFGFKDDIVIRIKDFESGSQLDMRSVSRVGVSDLGVNARRIRHFLKQFTAIPAGFEA